jgi:hypothetical protein
MNIITTRGISSLSFLLACGLLCSPLYAAIKNKATSTTKAAADDKETRYPIGCKPVGYEESLKVLSLFPGKEGALQSMYFFYNKRPDTVLAVGEPQVKFICSLGDGKKDYGQILDCAETIKVCEYVNVKFGLNNKGNYWIVESNTRNGAVNEVVHYGIIPGV